MEKVLFHKFDQNILTIVYSYLFSYPMRILYCTVLAATIPLTSCKKGQAKFKLTGIINDGSFSTTLNKATVSLYKIPAGGGTPVFIESLVSSDGSYYFEFEKDRSESYEIHITKDNYFDFVGEIFFSEMSIKTETVKNYTVYAESWAKLHFVNNNPQPGEQLKYIKTKGKADCLECCTQDYVYITDTPDTVIYCANNGNDQYAINYWLLGTTVSGSESVITTPFDTVEILVQY